MAPKQGAEEKKNDIARPAEHDTRVVRGWRAAELKISLAKSKLE